MEKPYAEKPHLTSTGGSGGPMLLVLYQPDIPQNAGTILRLGVCLGVPVEIVEPAGFMFTDKHFRRAGLDYAERATMRRHASWEAFLAQHREGRLVLLTTARRLITRNLPFAAMTNCCSAARVQAHQNGCTRRPMHGCASQ